MGTLYIVGNGLDLHFGLKTRSDHFIEHLKQQTVYNEIEYAFDILKYYGADWCEYEQSLNYMDLDEIEAQNIILPDYLSDRESDRDGGIVNMQMYVDSLSNAINTSLEQMVEIANDEVRKKSLLLSPKQVFKSGDAILTFNYTSTIEYLFAVPEDVPILHIHGCYDENTPLIFGYRNNGDSYTSAWASMDEEEWDYYIQQQREVVYSFYENWRKKIQIPELKKFLKKCCGIGEIVVLGHSMSDIDSEYMECIEKYIHPITWKVSYYEDADIQRIKEQRYSFQGKISFGKMNELLDDSQDSNMVINNMSKFNMQKGDHQKLIENRAVQFRKAIDKAHENREFDGIIPFNIFPGGCCEYTCDLLAHFLSMYNIKTKKINGAFWDDNIGYTQRHVWLQTTDDIVIDITGDQFKYESQYYYYNKKVYVGEEDNLHKLFSEDRIIEQNIKLEGPENAWRKVLNDVHNIIRKYL